MKKNLLLAITLAFFFCKMQIQAQSNDNQNNESLSQILNTDGSVKTEIGVNGSFNAKGFRLISKEGEAPKFEQINNIKSSKATGDNNWEDPFSIAAPNNYVGVVTVYNSTVYIGGSFTAIGGLACNHIAKWDGMQWSALGIGLNGSVETIVADASGNIYVGGNFTDAGGVTNADYLAKWTGFSWSAIGTTAAINSTVNAIAINGTNVYIGGYFTDAGGNANADYVALWNGTSWNSLGTTPLTGQVLAIAINGTNIYVGGNYLNAGGNANADYIALWNGTAWSALGTTPLNNLVYSIAISGTNIYVGGGYTNAGGNANADYIARWNGTSWNSLGTTPINSYVMSVLVSGTDVYISGLFDNAGGITTADRFAKWNGTTWSDIGGSPFTGNVDCIAINGTNLYAVGSFLDLNGDPSIDYIAVSNGSAWFGLRACVDNKITAIAVSGNNIYIGGWFETAGNTITGRIAKWDGSSWSLVGIPITGFIYVIYIEGTDIYVGGNFTNAGGNPNANFLAKWTGSNWASFGAGPGGTVKAIAIKGTDIYIGGSFENVAGNADADAIAKWNGSNWSNLGPGLNNANYGVNAIKIVGDDVYVGGGFPNMGGVANTNGIAKWNTLNNTWNSVKNGINGNVGAIEADANYLYVGGSFTDVGNRIVEYEFATATWKLMGSGISNGSVSSICLYGNDIFVGGNFTTGISRWDGSSWNALGSGIGFTTDGVFAIGLCNNYLYVGGGYYSAGGKPFEYLSQWNGLLPYINNQPQTTNVCIGENVTFSTTAFGNNLLYQWRKNGSDINGANANTYTINNVTTTNAASYTCYISNSNGNTTTLGANLVVNSPPSIINQPIDKTICEGLNTTFTVNASGYDLSYQWQINSGSGWSNLSNTGIYSNVKNATLNINGATASMNGYMQRCIIAGGCSPFIISNPVELTVSTPTAFAGNDVTICSGNAATLIASGGTTYAWSNGVNNDTITISPTSATTYTVTTTNSNGCKATDQVVVSVNALPTATITNVNPLNFCYGELTHLTANTGSGLFYQWYKNNTEIPGADLSTYTATQSGNYNVIVTNNNNCSKTSNSLTVVVADLPTTTITPQSDLEFCQGGSVTLNAPSGEAAYQWYLNNNPIQNATNSNYTANQTGNYKVKITNTNNCFAFSSLVNVIVYSNPTAIITNVGSTTVCDGNAVNLIVGTGQGYSYQWILNGNNVNNATSSSISAFDEGNYTVKVTTIDGCSVVSNPVAITINPLPDVNYTINGSTTICEGQTVSINIPNANNQIYQWRKNYLDINSAVNASYTASNQGVYDVFVVNTLTGCSNLSDFITIYVNQNPTPEISQSAELILCKADTAILETTNPYESYLWSNTSTTSTIKIDTSGIYSVTVTDINGCKGSTNYTVEEQVMTAPQICMVLVDSTSSKNLIVWDKEQTDQISSYNIYKETSSAGTYAIIGNVAYSATSIFTDNNSHPDVQSDRYRLSAIDLCGNETQQSTEHRTLHLGVVPASPSGWYLNWADSYEGFTFYTYNIYRKYNSGYVEFVTAIQSNLVSYTDVDAPSGVISYFVAAVKPGSSCLQNNNKEMGGPFSQSISNVDENAMATNIFDLNNDLNVAAYPNPFSEQTIIAFNNSEHKNYRLVLYTITGELVRVIDNVKDSKVIIERENLAKGFYTIELQGEKTFRGKLIVQ